MTELNGHLILNLTGVVNELTFVIGLLLVMTLLVVLSELFSFMRWISLHFIKRGDKQKKRRRQMSKKHRRSRKNKSSTHLKVSELPTQTPKEIKWLRNRSASASVASNTPVNAVLEAAQRWPSEASSQILPSEEFDERTIREHLPKTVLKKADLREMRFAARHNALGDLMPVVGGKSPLKAPPLVETTTVTSTVISASESKPLTAMPTVESATLLATAVAPKSSAVDLSTKSVPDGSTPLNSSHSDRS